MEKRLFFFQGKERQFYELDYIVEFKGIFETFLRENPKTETFLKYIQISNCKEIDLRKILNEYVFDAKKLDFFKVTITIILTKPYFNIIVFEY
ncbi:hypothetical protein LEP1GSC079_3960 [Leptospira interrogans str. FPW1039]|uniref:Uncharacterized protein n=1 Tax=Leptospira interrogans str. FPW1039 TaxID=1193040 RepID=A0A0F6IEV9_LEPIR|nr:hypothetical protein LEP1GSC079_3960 [Leptospira interrogans str. FPW1039]